MLLNAGRESSNQNGWWAWAKSSPLLAGRGWKTVRECALSGVFAETAAIATAVVKHDFGPSDATASWTLRSWQIPIHQLVNVCQNLRHRPIQMGQMRGHGAKFGRKKEQAIVALLSHPTLEQAARAVGVNPNTLLRWQKEPEFEKAYREARWAAFSQAVARLQQGSAAAATALL